MANDVGRNSEKVLSRSSLVPLFLATVYLAFLITPWALTCRVALDPRTLVRYDSVYNYEPAKAYSLNATMIAAIDVLNALSVVFSLPLLSLLLSRAAIGFTQRRRSKQKLTVGQLFGLADQGWWNPVGILRQGKTSAFLVFGWVLLALAIAVPLVRSRAVGRQSITLELGDPPAFNEFYGALGTSPGPALLQNVIGSQLIAEVGTRLQSTTGGVEMNLWPYCNDQNLTRYYDRACGFGYNPYDITQSTLSNFWEINGLYGYTTNGSATMFASTLTPNATTGTAGNGFALGLKSGTACTAVTSDQLSDKCNTIVGDLTGWKTNLTIPGELQLDICLPIFNATSTWTSVASFPWTPHAFTERLYIGIQELGNDSDWNCEGDADCLGTSDGLFVQCQVDTAMNYFQLGNTSSAGVPSPFLNNTPSDFAIPQGSGLATFTDDPSPGPLMSTAQAIFGTDSWLDWVAKTLQWADSTTTTTSTNDTMLAYLSVICRSMPLRNAEYFGPYTMTGGTCSAQQLQDYYLYYQSNSIPKVSAQVLREFLRIFHVPSEAQAALNTGAFFANDYLLSTALGFVEYGQNSSNSVYAYNPFELQFTAPVASLGAIIAISVLIGLQVVAVLVLLVCIYRRPVWTKALDALALASIGAQLLYLDGVTERRDQTTGTGTLGVVMIPTHRLVRMWKMDGLIDPKIVHRDVGSPDDNVELLALPPPYAPRGQQPASASGARTREVEADGQSSSAVAMRDAPPYRQPEEEEQEVDQRHAAVSTADGEDGVEVPHRAVSPVSPVSPTS